MCRLLGIASSEATDFKIVLRDAPRSLAALSLDHRDGWGLAVFDDESGWRIDKGVACASEDARFHNLAVGSRGELLVSHVRQKTIGETSLVNTHPFRRGRWVFAHNGTVRDVGWLRTQSSPKRLGEICGETDSELLFAWLLTCLDEAGVADASASPVTDRAIGAAARRAREQAGFGAFNFLLSDGLATYARARPARRRADPAHQPRRDCPRDPVVAQSERGDHRFRTDDRGAVGAARGGHAPAHRPHARPSLAAGQRLTGAAMGL
jgi:predicted glutamine amidotransferase